MNPSADPALTMPRARRSRLVKQILAWAVHFYTGLGLVAGAGMAVLIVRGDPTAIRWVFVLMLAATLIDATDGTLARLVKVKQVLPGFDGRRLDDIIDFLTYTVLPLFLLWRVQILPAGQEAWLLLPLLASAYGFCQVSAKTDDGYFLGFPSYWNLVAFYLYVLHFHVAPLPSWLAVGLLVGLAVLTFVPTRYLYTSQRGPLTKVTNLLAGVWVLFLAAILYRLPGGAAHETDVQADGWLVGLILGSLFFPVYYLGASWLISWRLWREERACRPLLPRQHASENPS